MQWLFMSLLQAKLDEFVGAWNAHSMRTVQDRLSPNGQALLAAESFYIAHDAEEFRTVAEELEEEYEGRQAARSQCPFITAAYAETFKTSCPPMTAQHTRADFLPIINHAFTEVNRLLLTFLK